MNNLELGYHELGEGYGYYIDKVPQNVLSELKIQINELQSDFSKGVKRNNHLAGEIEHEYLIQPELNTISYIKELSQQFENKSKHIKYNYKLLPHLKFDNLWINFQKKYEYNPIHNHDGVYSFVIWYKILYTFENEKKYNYKSSERGCHHGEFHFVTPNPFNLNRNIVNHPLPIDKTKEGYIAIFPSTLSHVVYPFYSSDEYRITVAGNIHEIR